MFCFSALTTDLCVSVEPRLAARARYVEGRQRGQRVLLSLPPIAVKASWSDGVRATQRDLLQHFTRWCPVSTQYGSQQTQFSKEILVISPKKICHQPFILFTSACCRLWVLTTICSLRQAGGQCPVAAFILEWRCRQVLFAGGKPSEKRPFLAERRWLSVCLCKGLCVPAGC